ncbi:uncharacterized protein CTRU02_214785 [Colletotrichum truncatum]|uniref:Uncharacterized protein n=1 Tax=Colletotrichum truncatum TaxID=5467 RepID=A0ACC3YFS4_COLTU|nr:uncharacterized protein CTRU02_09737 [Colletotrichum truncatum]KAF6788419.1 hypothetical protein CTRU02_09737 [Colletotrichum truncatum]
MRSVADIVRPALCLWLGNFVKLSRSKRMSISVLVENIISHHLTLL